MKISSLINEKNSGASKCFTYREYKISNAGMPLLDEGSHALKRIRSTIHVKGMMRFLIITRLINSSLKRRAFVRSWLVHKRTQMHSYFDIF